MTATIPTQRQYDSPEVEQVDLVNRAQAGDGEAMAELYRRNHGWMFGRIFLMVGKNRAVAEDLTADVFERMVRKIGTFTWQGKDFRAWLQTIAVNRVRDHFKQASTYRTRAAGSPFDRDSVLSAAAAHLDGCPEMTVLAYLASVELLEAVKQLTDAQQRVIVLRFLRGLSTAETAEVMGRTEPVVKSLQYRATIALGRLLPAGAR